MRPAQQQLRMLGRYEILERIAVGGMAEVYRAKVIGAAGFERLVAVKRILPGFSQDREFVAMFIDEAKIASSLTHGNICQIYDLGEYEGQYFIAMEYVYGRDVRYLLDAQAKQTRAKFGKIPPEFAAYIAAEACAGLDYAHRKTNEEGKSLRIVHRDVSPSNILVSVEGEVKIGDFGIAKAAEKLSKTRTGTIKGKYNYLAPEAVRGLQIDHRSDVFGIGTVLYEMLTGQKVFDAKSEIKILELVRAGQYTPARQLEPSIPLALEQILNKALTTDREKRYQSAAELEYALHGFLYSLGYRTSDGELSVFVRKTLGLPARQHNTLIPPAPADVGEKVQLVSPLVELMSEEESTENRVMRQSDFDSQVDTDTSAFREEKTSIVNIEDENLETERRLRESRTEMFSIDVLEPSGEEESTLSQNPTVVRSSGSQNPSLEPSAPVAQSKSFAQLFASMDGRQKFETMAAIVLGLLWMSISIYHAAY